VATVEKSNTDVMCSNVRAANHDNVKTHKYKKKAQNITTGDSVVRNLLFSLTAVEYKSEEEGKWCEVNPLLFPLIEHWKEKA
jgi:hypothetical protein